MSQKLTTIAFDADDTLWQNEQFFQLTQTRFAELLADYAEKDHLSDRLIAAERRNLGRYGFGIKGFVLSMIETALDVTDDKVPTNVVREIIQAGHEMLEHPVELLPHAQAVIEQLTDEYQILLITKGDLLDQERKLAQSSLGDLFDGVEIVSDKTPNVYKEIFDRHGDGPEHALMAGNSMKSDVLSALETGSFGVFVPHDLTWVFEHESPPVNHQKYFEIDHLGLLPPLIERLEHG